MIACRRSKKEGRRRRLGTSSMGDCTGQKLWFWGTPLNGGTGAYGLCDLFLCDTNKSADWNGRPNKSMLNKT
jgi:hypothetical protein